MKTKNNAGCGGTRPNLSRTATRVRSIVAATPQQTIAILTACALIATTALPARAYWPHARGDSANTSFARVDTLPARSPRYIPVGPVAPGVNPVIGPDGSVYFGDPSGNLFFRDPEGIQKFAPRQINPEHGGFFSSPVVGADGSVYVVSTKHDETTKLDQSFLHKFHPGGAWLYWVPFPKSTIYPFTDGGVTNAHPNIWRWNGKEVIMVPVKYRGSSGEDISLLAFDALTGAPLANQQVSFKDYGPVTGGSGFPDWDLDFIDALFLTGCAALLVPTAGGGCSILLLITHGGFGSPEAIDNIPLVGAGLPLPGVAIVPDPQGGPPRVAVNAREHQRLVFAFSPEAGFTELVRIRDQRSNLSTSPVALPNGSFLIGTLEGLLTRTGANFVSGATAGFGMMTAAPTLHKDGSLVVVSRDGLVTKYGSGPIWRHRPGGYSIASAAASCTHVFVSTTQNLYTYDARNMQLVATRSWAGTNPNGPGGGLSAPVIGKGGRVYVLANDYLLVFPGVTTPWGDDDPWNACMVLAPA